MGRGGRGGGPGGDRSGFGVMDSASLAMYRYSQHKSSGTAPPNYVPGIGRGAIGFTTRSDIGSASGPGDAQDRGSQFEKKKVEGDEDQIYGQDEDEFGGCVRRRRHFFVSNLALCLLE